MVQDSGSGTALCHHEEDIERREGAQTSATQGVRSTPAFFRLAGSGGAF
jgi:hypothetical protein